MTERLFVRDVMSVGVSTCKLETPVSNIVRLFLEEQLEGLIVLDNEGHAAGAISQDELLRAYARDDRLELTAEAIMCDSVPQVPPDIPLAAAAQLMQDQGVRVAFVMHHTAGTVYPAAVITYQHFLRHFAATDDDELSDLGIRAARRSPLETFIQKRDAARRNHQYPHQE